MTKKLQKLESGLSALKEKFKEAQKSQDLVAQYKMIDTLIYDARFRLNASSAMSPIRAYGLGAMAVGTPAAIMSGIHEADFSNPVLFGVTFVTSVLTAGVGFGCAVDFMAPDYIPQSRRAFDADRQAFLTTLNDAQKGLLDNVIQMAQSPGFNALAAENKDVKEAFSVAAMNKMISKKKAPVSKKSLNDGKLHL